MRHVYLATTLVLLLGSSVHAVPTRDGNLRAIQLAQQQASGNSSLSQQDDGNNAGQGQSSVAAGGQSVNGGKGTQGGASSAAIGLVALPGQQVTTGELRPLPGGAAAVATTAVAQSSVAVSETSALLGEVTSEVSKPPLRD